LQGFWFLFGDIGEIIKAHGQKTDHKIKKDEMEEKM
jgi:hypothetical protein